MSARRRETKGLSALLLVTAPAGPPIPLHTSQPYSTAGGESSCWPALLTEVTDCAIPQQGGAQEQPFAQRVCASCVCAMRDVRASTGVGGKGTAWKDARIATLLHFPSRPQQKMAEKTQAASV